MFAYKVPQQGSVGGHNWVKRNLDAAHSMISTLFYLVSQELFDFSQVSFYLLHPLFLQTLLMCTEESP